MAKVNPQILDEFVEFSGGMPSCTTFFRVKLPKPWLGFYCKWFILLDHEADWDTLCHELYHSLQHDNDWLFPFKYSFEYLKHGYEKNKYEIEAKEFEKKMLIFSWLRTTEKMKLDDK